MSDRNDGGPAFPSHTEHLTIQDPNKPYNGDSTSPDWNLNISYYPDGMSLRDYFAAKAMQAIISKGNGSDATGGEKGVPLIAKYSYEYADAMLRERDK